MTARGGRDRYRRDYPQRSEEKSQSSRGSAPPSRHLWVGNLSHNLTEAALSDYFLRFGELESVAFQPGRSYAFINFIKDEEAIAAMRGLQGFLVAGMPLKIEFAKAERPLTSLRDENYLLYRDEQRSTIRGSLFSQRDSKTHRASPEPFYPEKSRMTDKSIEPSEVLWIGFPSLLKVDEMILRKAFSPFGEIDKITAFPGRSYAFVQFRSVMAACRAKETLQGKLFGNPRVHICFAKSERGSSNSGRNSINVPPSPPFKSNGRTGSFENFLQDKNFGSLTGDPSDRSPHFNSILESGESDVSTLSRNSAFWTTGNSTFEQRRFADLGSEDMYEHGGSPTRDGGAHFHDFSSQKFPQRSPLYEDPWDSPEDTYGFHGAKKLKTGSISSEKEVLDYPFSDSEKERHIFPRIVSDFPQLGALDKKFESAPLGHKQIPDRLMNLSGSQGERNNHWKTSFEGNQVGYGSLPPNPVEWKRFAPESQQSSLNEEWKWEGTIAKGGTPVCRARCFPVGKVLNVMLPEFLDCTARTGLDMLAKHYYQAASAWVVFFVPESDADIGFYNEFMHYLEEKQRAAVAKLDDKTTLFLVPPSDFSEKVLKVPGKLSISGVVLRLEHPGSNFGSLHRLHEKPDTNFMPFHGHASHHKPTSPSVPFPSLTSHLGNVSTSVPPSSLSGSVHATGSISESSYENRHEYPVQQRDHLGPKNSPHILQNPISGSRNIPSHLFSAVDSIALEYQSVFPVQETSSSHHTTGNSGFPLPGNSKLSLQEMKPSVSSSLPTAALQHEQLAQLASSLIGQRRQSASCPVSLVGEDPRDTRRFNESDNSLTASQRRALQNDPVPSNLSTSQFGVEPQTQLQHRNLNVPASLPSCQRELQTGAQGNQQLQNAGATEDVEADPQKRLQATLQLAAALLQQIQQGKGT